jgi:hypothetical protein
VQKSAPRSWYGVPVVSAWQAILSRVRAIAMMALFFAPGLSCPPDRRTGRLYRACSRPRVRIAFQAAC